MGGQGSGNFNDPGEHEKAGSQSPGNPDPTGNLSDKDREKGGEHSHQND